MFSRATGSKSKTLIASFGEAMRSSIVIDPHMIGSGSLEGASSPSAAAPASPGQAGRGLPETNFRKRRRLSVFRLESVMFVSCLVDSRAGGFHHRRPFGDLGLHEGAELLRRVPRTARALAGQPRLYFRRAHDAHRFRVPALHDLGGRAGGGEEPDPVIDLES